jgi:hypothetical protein
VAVHFLSIDNTGFEFRLEKRWLASIRHTRRLTALDLLVCTASSPKACVIVMEDAVHAANAIVTTLHGTGSAACRARRDDRPSELRRFRLRAGGAVGGVGTGKSPSLQYDHENCFSAEGSGPDPKTTQAHQKVGAACVRST